MPSIETEEIKERLTALIAGIEQLKIEYVGAKPEDLDEILFALRNIVILI